MNEFYSIGEEGRDLENSYQLKNLGSQKISMIVGKRVRGDWGESDTYQSDRLYAKTTNEDYDRSFAHKIAKTKPPYEIGNLLDYHLGYYVNQNNGTKEKFIKHIKYVIMPLISKQQDKEVYLQLLNEWLAENQDNINYRKDNIIKTIQFGDINAPTQIQVDSSHSQQTQSITYSKEDISELFSLIRADLEYVRSDFKEDLKNEIENAIRYLERGKDIKSRLLTIGSLVKDIGINVFANLIASPIFELLKPALGII